MKNAAKKNPPETQSFSESGPIKLTSIEWESFDHRRSVAAALIQGVYELEFKRQGATPQHQSPPSVWCHFHLFKVLKDDDSSIFGAIYESKQPQSNWPKATTLSPPRYIMAFRGTITTHETLVRDIGINFQFLFNRVHLHSRYIRAVKTFTTVFESVGNESVWLCGHSQGAAIALQVGREKAKSGLYIETFLFNPPYASLFPIEHIKDDRLRSGVRYAKSIITAGINFATKHGGDEKEQDSFRKLCSWIPYMFVHPKDPFSSEYIGYFEHKEKMVKSGLAGIDKLATEKSFTSGVSGLFSVAAEATHLIPSAYVVKNLASAEDFKKAHSIAQWWMPLQKCEPKLYQTKV